MAIAFAEACERAEEDDCRVVLLAARGRSFCRGIEGQPSEWPHLVGTDFVGSLARVTRPVVAAIQGRAEAEGFELALAADLRIAAPDTRFRLPQVVQGRLPRFGATQRLPRTIGCARALQALLLGEPISGRKALAWGLVAAVSSRPEALAARYARALAERGPVALRFAKEAVRRALDLPLDDGARFEHDLYSLLETTRDRAEGVRSFLERRKPRFEGR
jgi:enoyl-CoA hydratase/carnithine racemase